MTKSTSCSVSSGNMGSETQQAALRSELCRVPEIRAWIREPGLPTSALATVVAGDVLPPVVFEMGLFGWAPTVEMSVGLRSAPAPGWLRMRTRAHLVADGWFDEDVDIWDSTGRLVARARQLARVGRGPRSS